ncbi:molybdate transport system substrate-binding protein [Carboxydocella thermautotrophica]|nr:molybdate transport system substrate-binding protein [Carboxydocella thermautotrophica]
MQSRKTVLLLVLMLLAGILTGCTAAQKAKEPLTIFAGSAVKPPLEEVIQAFTARTGIPVQASYGGSGTMLSQMLLAQKGDLYIPGSHDFMDIAETKQAVKPESRKIVAYLVPAIVVPKGNPKGIKTLADLARPGVKVGIAEPKTVCLGLYAKDIFAKNGLTAAIEKNIVVTPKSCEDTATVAALNQVDAVIGWTVFDNWNPEKLEVIPLPKEQLVKIGNIPVAISRFSQQPETAQKFIDFLTSERGKEIFRKHGYAVDEKEVKF